MPDFASQEYWDSRFRKDPTPFDWLLPARILLDISKEVIEKTNLSRPEILHIGCGTSDAHLLRTLPGIQHAKQILNVDYSQPAIRAGSKREQELLADELISSLLEPGAKHDSVQSELPPAMGWSCMDLLSLHSALSLLHLRVNEAKLFDIVLDKSTSDSIACGPSVDTTLPYPLSINGWTRRISGSGTAQLASVHPLHVLAVHIAALTTPRTGRWIVVSYSEDRFPFVPPFPATVGNGLLEDDIIKAGFPHPNQLWRLECKEKIDPVERDESLAERKNRLASGYVHRPTVSHWLYILRRTDAFVTD